MQTAWFVKNLLRPSFERYFANNQSAAGSALGFDVGVGIDHGDVSLPSSSASAERTMSPGSDNAPRPRRSCQTRLRRLRTSRSLEACTTGSIGSQVFDETHMWIDEEFLEFGGVSGAVGRTSDWWSI